MRFNREDFTSSIVKRLKETLPQCKRDFRESSPGIGYFVIDDLLSPEQAQALYNVFPEAQKMLLKKSLREDKYVAAQMNHYDQMLEDAIYAFQDQEVVNLIEEITGIEHMFPDENLYAGGISLMGKNQFLNPHLDNSHDKDRNRWRVLNLLFYVTPDWIEDYGGNLELWPGGLDQKPTRIPGRFNRLVVMATHNQSLHSVFPIATDAYRRCISNYYFAKNPLRETDQFHVTSFRARPGNILKDRILVADNWLRMKIRKVFKKGIVENPHVYKKKK